MKMLIFLLSGPLILALGYLFGYVVVFWIGAAICAINLFLNVASGVMSFPVLPIVIMYFTTFFVHPWFVASAIGLGIWTSSEAVGEIYGRLSENRTGR